MRLVTEEEAEKFLFDSEGKSYLRLRLEAMKPGEILHLQRSDVPNKRGPFETVRRVSRGKKDYRVKTIYGGGWLVERLQ